LHCGLSLEHLALTKAHLRVEGSHRAAAWCTVLDLVSEDARPGVVAAMCACRDAWARYRDEVAEACWV